MARLVFVTHPEVVIDPAVPVPDWPLSAKGRSRMEVFLRDPIVRDVRLVACSGERKARDGAEILASHFGVPIRVDEELGENDRSSTGFIAPPEFWEVVDRFFAAPNESVRGWERAADAQSRIVRAVARVARDASVGRRRRHRLAWRRRRAPARASQGGAGRPALRSTAWRRRMHHRHGPGAI